MLATNSAVYTVQRTCRSCLRDSNEVISLQRPLDGVAGCNSSSIAGKTIAEAMMECANVQVFFDSHQLLSPSIFDENSVCVYSSNLAMGCRRMCAAPAFLS